MGKIQIFFNNISDLIIRFRLWLSSLSIRFALFIIAKETVEGMALIVAIESWVKYLEELYNIDKEKLNEN